MNNKLKKHIVIVSYYFAPLNEIASVRASKLAKYLSKRGYKVTVVTSKNRELTDIKDKKLFEGNFDIIESFTFDEILIRSFLKRFFKNKQKSKANGNHDVNKNNDVNRKNVISESNKDNEKNDISNNTKERNSNLDKLKTKKNKRKLSSLFKQLYYLIFHSGNITWYWSIRGKLRNYFDQNNPNVIFSTYGPITSHIIGKYLKSRYGGKWICDFRDMYAGNPYHTNFQRKYLNKRYKNKQNKIMENCDLATTVSPQLADILRENLIHNIPVEVLTNGYDEDDFNYDISLYDKFTIVYSGALYGGVRNPSPLFIALSNLMQNNLINSEKIQIIYMGREFSIFKELGQKFKVGNLLVNKGFVPREKSLEEQQRAHLLLLLGMNSDKDKGVFTGKLFEYIGTNKPILFIGNKENGLKDIIEKYELGKCYNANEIKGIEEYILKIYNAFIQTGEILKLSKCKEFSYNNIVEIFKSFIE